MMVLSGCFANKDQKKRYKASFSFLTFQHKFAPTFNKIYYNIYG